MIIRLELQAPAGKLARFAKPESSRQYFGNIF